MTSLKDSLVQQDNSKYPQLSSEPLTWVTKPWLFDCSDNEDEDESSSSDDWKLQFN